MQIKKKHTFRTQFNVNKETHAKPLLQELNAFNVYQISLLQVHVFIKGVETATSRKVFSTYFQLINHVYQTRFSKHNFKAQDYRIIASPRHEKMPSVLSHLTHLFPMHPFSTP